jgi:hypothetical protein
MKYRREPIDPPDSLVPSDEDESSIFTAADIAAAEERGRREGYMKGLRRAVDQMSGYMSRADSMLYDADIEALLAEKEEGE